MARIIYPTELSMQRKLLANIKAKDDSMGTKSVLAALLAQNNITLDDDITAGIAAAEKEELSLLLSRQSENYYQLRILMGKPVINRMAKELQFLKAFYKKNIAALGDWGATVNGNRIVMPSEMDELITLLGNIIDKNDSYVSPAVSPLAPFLTQQEIDLADDAETLGKANENLDKGQQAALDSEEATAQRNLLWKDPEAHLHIIGDYLIKLYPQNPKTLGEYGFRVDHSKRAPKEQTSKLKVGQQKTVNAVIIGGTFTNLGEGELHLYRGKTTKGTPLIIPPKGKAGILKGYSTITVVNPSTLISGIFKVLSSK